MAYKVKFSKSSLCDLKVIKEYICENNQEAAREVVAHVINCIERVIVPNPSAGIAGRVLRTRELVISKYPYIAPYQVRENVIYILRVLHTLRKWELRGV